jgi:two-component system nitrogen regulation response regulator NtrX
MNAAILIVDDEANIRRMLTSLLEQDGHRVESAPTGEAALVTLENEDFDVVLLDLMLPGADGITILSRIAERKPDLPVVMMSGRATLGDAVRATRLGAFHFIEKPVSPDAMLLTVRSALELSRARRIARATISELTESARLVGGSAKLQGIRDLIATVAPTEARVLITGESGTGKELVAAALHTASRRARGPFVRINSAALPRDLIESEMFGHEKGAFTGATQKHRGKFELADGGTLFLDEIAELGAEAQSKLLRAIESGDYQRVGGERTLRADVRVVAATNRDLTREIEAGRFRDDLFYRLNVVPIHVPPLRERVEDIPDLIQHFMRKYGSRERPVIFPPEAMRHLQQYRWPGNVRELANFCERLAILHPGATVEPHLLARLLPIDSPNGARASLPDQLDAYERKLIEDALTLADGNITEAARQLATDRPNLYRRMRRLGIDR